ncbi:MAG: glycosyltransferase [Sphingobacteriales bacterium]|nr:glycosyltransferase [Sphingobacteriales bacterium]
MKVSILIPLYNDWESGAELIGRIRSVMSSIACEEFRCFIVDDASTANCPESLKHHFGDVEIIRLNRNVGHQRAITIGLCHLSAHHTPDHVVVMDGDGEDKPEDIPLLLEESAKKNGHIIFGQRKKRFESSTFRLFYAAYKSVFRILTGKTISFGNFCAIPFSRLQDLVFVPDLWNHFSGGIIRTGIPYSTLSLDRGKRYRGESKMNFVSLVLHGLGAISVHTDTLAVRMLLSSLIMICLLSIGIIVVAGIRFFTPLAIPGWASFVVIGLLILIFQAFLISLLLVFNVLNYRTQRHIIPALEYTNFIRSIAKW